MIVIKHKNKMFESSLDPDASSVEKWIRPDGTIVNFTLVKKCITAALNHIENYFPAIHEILTQKDIFYKDDPSFDTMCTDGKSIFINPSWVEYMINKLGSKRAIAGMEAVIIHECLHILFYHTVEINNTGYDHDRANRAQDYEINYFIENILQSNDERHRDMYVGITKELEGLYDERYKNMVWQGIYPSVPYEPRKINKTTQTWKDGFLDGLLGTLKNMRENGLIEQYEIR